jgi:hypothetical protein
MKLKYFHEAQKDFEKVLELDPDNKSAVNYTKKLKK